MGNHVFFPKPHLFRPHLYAQKYIFQANPTVRPLVLQYSTTKKSPEDRASWRGVVIGSAALSSREPVWRDKPQRKKCPRGMRHWLLSPYPGIAVNQSLPAGGSTSLQLLCTADQSWIRQSHCQLHKTKVIFAPNNKQNFENRFRRYFIFYRPTCIV